MPCWKKNEEVCGLPSEAPAHMSVQYCVFCIQDCYQIIFGIWNGSEEVGYLKLLLGCTCNENEYLIFVIDIYVIVFGIQKSGGGLSEAARVMPSLLC